jgi:hypothetical protein
MDVIPVAEDAGERDRIQPKPGRRIVPGHPEGRGPLDEGDIDDLPPRRRRPS